MRSRASPGSELASRSGVVVSTDGASGLTPSFRAGWTLGSPENAGDDLVFLAIDDCPDGNARASQRGRTMRVTELSNDRLEPLPASIRHPAVCGIPGWRLDFRHSLAIWLSSRTEEALDDVCAN